MSPFRTQSSFPRFVPTASAEPLCDALVAAPEPEPDRIVPRMHWWSRLRRVERVEVVGWSEDPKAADGA